MHICIIVWQLKLDLNAYTLVFDDNDWSSMAYDLAECKADLCWISAIKTYMRSEHGRYKMRFPNVTQMPEFERLEQQLNDTISAGEKLVTQEIEAHLKYLEDKTRQELQRLKKARADEMGSYTSDNISMPKDAPVKWDQLSESQKRVFLTICAGHPSMKPDMEAGAEAEKPQSPKKQEEGN